MRRKLFVLCLFLGLSVAFVGVASLSHKASAACSPLPNDKGQASGTITVSSTANYTVWVRMWAQAAASDSVYVQIDSQCPVVIGDAESGDGFRWFNFKDGLPSQPVRYDLAAGPHTVTLAGREPGAGVDRVILLSNPNCAPTGTGDNCLSGDVMTPASPETAHTTTQTTATPATKTRSINWWLLGVCAVVVAGSLGVLVWHYLAFMKRMRVASNSGVTAGSAVHPDASLLTKLAHFVRHHKVVVILCGASVVVAVIVGVVAAAATVPVFDVATGKLSGGASAVANSSAASGKYVVFTTNPPASSGGASSTTQSGGGSSSGASNSGGSNAGGSSGNSGGSNSGGGATSSCALPKYPDASCTGVPAGTSLTNYTGPTDITAANTVIDSKLITSCITIDAPGVIIKKSRINATGCAPDVILVNAASKYHGGFSGAGATIEDSEISCMTSLSGGSATNGTAIGDNNVTVLRNNIYGCENGFDMDLNADIEDNYIHNLYQSDVAHTDGLQSYDGSNMKLIHNTFYGDTPLCPNPDFCAGTSAVNVNANSQNGVHTSGLIIKSNLLAGGAYTLYCPVLSTSGDVIQDNHFSFIFRDPNSPRTYGPGVAAPWKPDAGPGVGDYGPMTDCQDEGTVSGNVYHETGQAVPIT